MKKKWLALLSSLLVVVLTVTCLICVTAAHTDPPELKILANNLIFGDTVSLEYAVSHENADSVSLLLWTEPQTEYTYATAKKVLTAPARSVTLAEHSCFVFVYSDLAAKQMADDVYARAYIKVDETEYYSELSKYSVLQYAYNKLGKTGTATDNAALRDLLIGMLDYGSLAQKYLNYRTDHLANAEFYQISAVGATLPDGSDHGFYLPGDSVTLTAPATNAQGSFDHWIKSDGESVGFFPTLNVTVGAKNEHYTAVFEHHSAGLTYTSNGDGTCYVAGMGTCTDTDIIIAPVVNGDYVTEISRNAFSGTSVTSIRIPETVTYVGSGAFNGTPLNKVYFGGSKEQWAEIEIGANNAPLKNASVEFAVTTYTVTFKDWDGSTLDTQVVRAGTDAVPPADPFRTNHTFLGWEGDYTNVSADTVVTATYEINSIPISTPEELLAITGEENVKYSLVNDINMKGQVISGGLGVFAGELDGKGHKVYNFVLNETRTSYCGFFTQNKGIIKNITFENFTYSATNENVSLTRVGFLAGENLGTLENCHIVNAECNYVITIYSRDNTYQSQVGVLVGRNAGTIRDCSIEYKLNMTDTNRHDDRWDKGANRDGYVGTVVGLNRGLVEDCSADGTIIFTQNCSVDKHTGSRKTSEIRLGGFVGQNSAGGQIYDSTCHVDISVGESGDCTRNLYVGGFAGRGYTEGGQNSIIGRCSVSGTITNRTTGFSWIGVGGFISSNEVGCEVSDCMAEVATTFSCGSSRVSGFVAYNAGKVSYSYASGSIKMTTTNTNGASGFVGYSDNGGSVSSCFCRTDLDVVQTDNVHAFAGQFDTGAVIFQCHSGSEATLLYKGAANAFTDSHATPQTDATLKSADFIFDQLYWDPEVWSVTDGSYPVLK